jgi:outer membrane protein assembly factor BamD (BamD/ComL family)
MSAYAHYEGTQYDESVGAAKRYVTCIPAARTPPTRST